MFDIAGRKISENHKPFVIVEIGINHEGNLDVAKKMVDAAFAAGAECIKHQTHIVDDEMSKEAKNVIPGNTSDSIYDVMSRCALNEADEFELMRYVEDKGMIFLSTPFSRAAVDRLERFNVSAYKIGSGECNNYPLIEYIARLKKPMIVSTGMNDLRSVTKTVDIIRKYETPFALLHTTNLYPTPVHLVRLGAMLELKVAFPDIVYGLSDHTTSNRACFAATALGASILERHFTDTLERKGPDIINSMDPIALKELLIGSEEIALMRGGKKEPAREEKVTIDFAFATVVSIEEIEQDEVLSEENIWVKRPGTGEIQAEHYQSLIGKKAVRNIPKDSHIKWSDFE